MMQCQLSNVTGGRIRSCSDLPCILSGGNRQVSRILLRSQSELNLGLTVSNDSYQYLVPFIKLAGASASGFGSTTCLRFAEHRYSDCDGVLLFPGTPWLGSASLCRRSSASSVGYNGRIVSRRLNPLAGLGSQYFDVAFCKLGRDVAVLKWRGSKHELASESYGNASCESFIKTLKRDSCGETEGVSTPAVRSVA